MHLFGTIFSRRFDALWSIHNSRMVYVGTNYSAHVQGNEEYVTQCNGILDNKKNIENVCKGKVE